MTNTPGYQGTTQETSRVAKRGQLEYFFFKFFYDTDELQPVVSLDIQQYPNFRIFSPDGEMIQQGTAIPTGVPGNWKLGWIVPKGAPLSTVHKRYRLQVVMVDEGTRQFETTFEFDVVETAIPAQGAEVQQLLTFVGEPLRISFTNTVRPSLLRVKIIKRGNDSSPIHFAAWNGATALGANDLKEIEKDNSFVYYTDIPALPSEGEYSAIWVVRDFELSPQDIEHQAIEVVTSSTMHQVKSLRILIDKLQKKLGIVYSYSNEDMIEYLKEGSRIINSYSPPTSYSLSSIPAPLEAFLILAAGWWGLTAQRILYAETNFDFSGQTVTLGYNPGADLDGIISSFKEILDSQLRATKKSLFRQSSAVGSLASRPTRQRSGLVFKTNKYTGANTNLIFSKLAEYGLLLDW